MPEQIPNGSTTRIPLYLVLSSDHVTPATGKTLAVTISKNGAAFGNPSAGATNATEIASGWYYYTPSATDTGTNGPLLILGTAASCDAATIGYSVVTAPPTDASIADAVWDEARSGHTTSGTFGQYTNANLTHILGVAVNVSDFTIASATASTITLPALYTDGTAIPDDGRYAGVAIQVVGGTGQGQVVRLSTATLNAREYNVAAGSMPVQLDATSTCIIFDSLCVEGTSISAIATEVWTDLLAGSDFSVVGSIGKLLKDDVNATISSRLAPTVAGRTLDVSVGGASGVDWANVESQDTVVALTNTTIHAVDVLNPGSITNTSIDASAYTAIANEVLTIDMTESYSALGAEMTVAQALYGMISFCWERNGAGTLITTKKLDRTTTSMEFTINSATAPTAQTRTA